MDAIVSEAWLRDLVGLFVRLVEAAGALVIFGGAALAFVVLCVGIAKRQLPQMYNSVRLRLGRVLALGLEFQLASDLLRTAVAPTYEEIGKLAAVAAIRTGLNYFLARELSDRSAGEPGPLTGSASSC